MLPVGIGKSELTILSFLSFKQLPLDNGGNEINIKSLITICFAILFGLLALFLRRIVN